jgi:hypothetical protein
MKRAWSIHHTYLLKRVREALADLKPYDIKVTRRRDVFNVLVISEQFQGVPVTRRFTMVLGLLEKNANTLMDHYTPIIEPVTKLEYETKIIGKCVRGSYEV